LVLQLVREFLAEQPLAPDTFAMGALLDELNGVNSPSHSQGMHAAVLSFSLAKQILLD